jgi:DGQHR domain-containing protein
VRVEIRKKRESKMTIEQTAEASLPVVLTKLRSNTQLAVGAMTAGVLVKHFFVPRRDSRHKTGYQREVTTARVNRLVKDLKDGRVDLPTSILLNLREYNPAIHLTNGRECLNLFPGDRLYVVDGQHRAAALQKLVDENPDRWSQFQVPFVCMLGAQEPEEIKQFYVVNSTAKSVRTDLALDLLKQRAETEPGLVDALIERGEMWKVKGQKITEELANTPIWRGRIRFPGDAPGDSTLRSSGMVASLKHVLSSPFFSQLAESQQVRILDAYWRGVKKVIPEAFEEASDYVLQKATGVLVMHDLLVLAIEYVRSTGRSLVEPEPFADALETALSQLEGDNSNGEISRGADFWLSGPDGAAGSYSSNAGRRVLVAKLRGSLPEIEVE